MGREERRHTGHHLPASQSGAKAEKKLGMKFNDFRKQINLAICKPVVLHILSGLLFNSFEVNFAVLSIHSSSHHGVLGEANHGGGGDRRGA